MTDTKIPTIPGVLSLDLRAAAPSMPGGPSWATEGALLGGSPPLDTFRLEEPRLAHAAGPVLALHLSPPFGDDRCERPLDDADLPAPDADDDEAGEEGSGAPGASAAPTTGPAATGAIAATADHERHERRAARKKADSDSERRAHGVREAQEEVARASEDLDRHEREVDPAHPQPARPRHPLA